MTELEKITHKVVRLLGFGPTDAPVYYWNVRAEFLKKELKDPKNMENFLCSFKLRSRFSYKHISNAVARRVEQLANEELESRIPADSTVKRARA